MAQHEKKDDSGLFVMPDEYIIPDNVYNVLKWIALILLPALAVLIGTIGPQWGIPYIDAIVTTINAIGFFIGTCIGASQFNANRYK